MMSASKLCCSAVLVAAAICGVNGSVCKMLDSPGMVCQKTDSVVDVRYLSLDTTSIDDLAAQSTCNK
jgi:E3 ubiquitin-protein ligase DOA10